MEELKSVLKSARLGDFLLQDHSVREAVDRLGEDLSFAERAELLILFHKYPGTVMYDATSLFKAQILIDDRLFEGKSNKPLSYILFNSQRDHTRVEVVDILGSVRQNAAAISHPAIAAAIKHWQRILLSRRYVTDTDADDVEAEPIVWQAELHERFRELAKANLRSVGRAIEKGARFQGSSSVAAYDRDVRDLTIVGKGNYLYLAWLRLHRRYVDETHEPDERVAAIAKHLQSSPRPIDSDRPDLPSVIDFLNSAGTKFVYSEESVDSQRPKWDVFRTEFLRWQLDLKPSTHTKHHNRSKRLVDRTDEDVSGFFGSLTPDSLWASISSNLSTPLVFYCPPLLLPPYVRDVQTIRKAILRQKGTKT